MTRSHPAAAEPLPSGAPSLMEAKLIIIKGKANKAEVSLKLPSTIGRSREADLTIAHPMVSRQHCQVFEVNGLLKVRDLGSLNGTFLGDQQIQEADLYPDTEFSVGPLTFRVVYQYAGSPGTAPTTALTEGQAAVGSDAVNDTPDSEPATDEPPATPPPPQSAPPYGGPLDFDGGPADVSNWGPVLREEQISQPSVPTPAAPAQNADEAAEQYAADALAEEDDGESFIGQLPDAHPGNDASLAPPAEHEPPQLVESTLPASVPELPEMPLPTAEASATAEIEPNGEPSEADEADTPAKKRKWWPFGAKPTAKETPQPAASPDEEPTLPATEDEAVPDFLSAPEEPAVPTTDEPRPDDSSLGQFLKGLK